jgi:hypothetical protein
LARFSFVLMLQKPTLKPSLLPQKHLVIQ